MHLETSHSAIAWRGYLALSLLGLFACGGDDPAGPDRGATQLAFLTEPLTVEAGAAIDPGIVVEVRDASGRRVGDAELPVTLSLGQSPDGAALSGTKTVGSVGGVASFSGLSLDSAGTGYTLTARADDLSAAESASFEVMPGPPASLAVSPTPARLNAIGDTLQLEATVHDQVGNAVAGVDVAWSSANPNVATVDESGRAVSVAEGEAMITAEANGVEGDVALKVDQVAATLTVSPSVDTLAEGETVELVAVAADSNGVEMADPEIAWVSEVAAVAAVSSIGAATADVEALRGGRTRIVASVDGRNGTAEIEVLRKIAFASLHDRVDRDSDSNWEIYVMNADGSGQARLTHHSALDMEPAWSTDGRIAFTSARDGNFQIYVMNPDGSDQTRLTNNSAVDAHPSWSPDGSRIAFMSYRDGNPEIHIMNADGSGEPINVTNHSGSDQGPAWSPAGDRIAFWSDRDGIQEIYVMNADGSDQTRLTSSSGIDRFPSWSPDGERIVFSRLLDSGWEIFVMNADGGDQRSVSQGTSLWPAWSPVVDKIAFTGITHVSYDIYVMNPDGSERVRLTNNPRHDYQPAWRPDPQP